MFKQISEIRDYIKGELKSHLGGKINTVDETIYQNEKKGRSKLKATYCGDESKNLTEILFKVTEKRKKHKGG